MTALETLRFGLARHREDDTWRIFSPIKAAERGGDSDDDDDTREHGIAVAAIHESAVRILGRSLWDVQLDQAKRVAIFADAVARMEKRLASASRNQNQLDLFGGVA